MLIPLVVDFIAGHAMFAEEEVCNHISKRLDDVWDHTGMSWLNETLP